MELEHRAGVYVSPGSAKNRIGLNSSNDSGVVANVISGNRGSGILMRGTSGNTVVANRIGTNPAGTATIANRGDGISITKRSMGNVIGGSQYVDASTGKANDPTGSKGTVAPVFVVPPLGNLVSGNAKNGIPISSKSEMNVLNGNFIGTTPDGNSALGNAGTGVRIKGANGNRLIGCTVSENPFVYYNVLSGNQKNGLRITNSNKVVVHANFFGVGANNTNVLPNRLDGILVDGSSRNTQVGGVIPLGNVAAF
jgi:parallel beta-helix repeat protein